MAPRASIIALGGSMTRPALNRQGKRRSLKAAPGRGSCAFCRWATDVLRAARQTIEIRLPSEAEWEKAARGTDRQAYLPVGNEAPDKTRCNFDVNEGDTTSVDRYPQGKSAYDVWDMGGNVWEWTLSLSEAYPYDLNDGREDMAAAGDRVVRGGSFVVVQRFVRCACRDRYDIVDRFGGFGFRVMSPGS
ncbi:MAG: SUMF1/EgtB/PvdO family nonheme iron enzyme [Caldilineaceae bacterium]|nr:SUMF1/EgtB/PvdO family nonheme iron enzyme [Caldilineaceae bacterium]